MMMRVFATGRERLRRLAYAVGVGLWRYAPERTLRVALWLDARAKRKSWCGCDGRAARLRTWLNRSMRLYLLED